MIPWTAAHKTSLSFTISWSLLKFTSIESVMPFIKIKKQLKLADCKPYGNSPSREVVQTPAHTISKQGLGREARRGLHRLE